MKKYVFFILAVLLVMGAYVTASADVHDGERNFKKYCAKCHGNDGSVSEYGRSMKPQARNLQTNRLFISPTRLLNIIKYGLYGRDMKGWQFTLTDQQIVGVAEFIRTLKYEPNAKAGKAFYVKNCASCHSPRSSLKSFFKAPDLDMSPLGNQGMAKAIRFGRHESMTMPKMELFRNTELADVIEYLQSIKK